MCDFDHAKIHKSVRRRSRRDRRCCECGTTISAGETYVCDSLLGDSWAHYNTCTACDRLRDLYLSHFDCVVFGSLYDHMNGEPLDEHVWRVYQRWDWAHQRDGEDRVDAWRRDRAGVGRVPEVVR